MFVCARKLGFLWCVHLYYRPLTGILSCTMCIDCVNGDSNGLSSDNRITTDSSDLYFASD